MTNLGDTPLRVVNVELSDPQGLELVSFALYENGCVGTREYCASNQPALAEIAPGGSQHAPFLATELKLTGTNKQGWAKGVWVTIEGENDKRIRQHNCVALYVDQTKCNMDESVIPVEEQRSHCNLTEPA